MQLTELRAFAARMSWLLVEYIETASGKAGAKRPQRLLSDAKLRRFDIVLVW
jgi:DNA invertase Pin-like site-specific DNA recombinase